ncbi:hypothetical protein K461DRAFT_309153 [Myriangium duriaei CBS 260.36]|uniref:Uncharacterized protein n=1 Tax=Myriangium duriaei CBS 260.36 TaxID=1168546 RepID=A0A9P4J8U6_9PEZI|nr:hypothetical protein K461DRAFT_309153 [Myriangium duriaei CBS 260.36]
MNLRPHRAQLSLHSIFNLFLDLPPTSNRGVLLVNACATMEIESLTRLQGLQADLTAFSESRLPNLERLWAELEDSLSVFRQLLAHKQKNEQSRRSLANDRILFDDSEYSINDEFRQEAIQVADELDLDELEAARLLLATQEDTLQDPNRSPTLSAIAHYHGNREALLGALRLVFQLALDSEIEPETRETFGKVVELVLQKESGTADGSWYWNQCQDSMNTIEGWVKRLRDRLNSINVIGETRHSFAAQALEFQRSSLVRQHESLASILASLVKLGHASTSNYNDLLNTAAKLDKFDEIVIHYIPLLIAFPICVGAGDGFAPMHDVRSLDNRFSDKTGTQRWSMTDFRAAATVWWLAEYSGRCSDTAHTPSGLDLEQESDARSDRVMTALREGAFQFVLLVCSKIRPQLWHDPAKSGLIGFLLGSSRIERSDPITISDYFAELLFDKLQIFIEALISNMPDTIRRLKHEEDEQRRNMGAALSQPQHENSLHLERFLSIISYAFHQSPDQAMEAFWADPDGNMYGFLQWASKRQSTPRAAAFCEMFQAIAESDECADAAHKFLIEEAIGASSAKLRRSVSLSWSQIFAELTFYADRLRDSPSLLSGPQDNALAAQTSEPESALMLECYLRLTTHMCCNSASAREFLLNHPEFRLHEVLFDLCKSGIESRFKACAFNTLSSLLVNKTIDTSYGMWDALDAWICGVPTTKSGMIKANQVQSFSEAAMTARLRPIASGFEEPNAFVRFLQRLIELPTDQQALNDALAFSEQLGVNYRMSGIDQYVDFVFSMVMTGVLPNLEDNNQVWELRCACLDFIRVSLSTFNEDLVIFANTTNVNVDTAMSTSSLATYVKLHPFARVMEWLFNDAVIKQLFEASHADPDTLTSAPSDSPLVTTVARSIQVIDLIMRLQSTYFDIVRPLVKTQSATRSRQVANPTLASFEDAILANINIVVDLGLYCSTAFEHLTSLSLALLQRLAQSRKLAGPVGGFSQEKPYSSRLLAALQQTNDVDRISSSFIGPLEVDPREMEAGSQAPGYAIKMAILDLLNNSLEVSSSRPGLAHCLLGFTCTDQTITFSPDSRFDRGSSLFHAVARLYAETATTDPALNTPWLTAVRCKASEILRKLIVSPLTSQIILAQLRESGFNDVVAISQQPFSSSGVIRQLNNDTDFLISEASSVFRNLLEERAAYFEHEALELRTATLSQSLSLQAKAKASLLGSSTLPTGESVQHANVFDLFDFFEENVTAPPSLAALRFMANLDFETCRTGGSDDETQYDLRLVKELLLLREAELRKNGDLYDEPTVQQCQLEAEALLTYMNAENQSLSIKAAQRNAANAWVQLITVMLSSAGLEGVQKSAFVLQALQIVLPKIDLGLAQESSTILPLVKLVYALVQAHSGTSTSASSSPVPTDRLFTAFRTALSCITSTLDSSSLREVSYQILSRLLSSTPSIHSSALKALSSAPERLLDITTEDALSSSPSTRISALLLLRSTTHLSLRQKSPTILRALSRLNFISSLVDALRSIPGLFSSPPPNLEQTLTILRAVLDLLLVLAQDSRGADALLEAGLFPAVRESGLFAADPELGDVQGEEAALTRYYTLLAGVLRVVGAVVCVKGKRNEGVQRAGRAMVGESRACLVAVLKAGRKGGNGWGKETKDVLREVEEGWVTLVWGTDWLEYDEKPAAGAKRSGLAFT